MLVAVRDRDACQTATIVKCIIADAVHTVQDYNACQTAAIVERIITYLLCTFRDNNFSLQQLSIDVEIVGIAHRIGTITIKFYPQPSSQVALIVDIR